MPGMAGNLLAQQVAQPRAFCGDPFQPLQLGGGDGDLRAAHAVVGGEELLSRGAVARAAAVASLVGELEQDRGRSGRRSRPRCRRRRQLMILEICSEKQRKSPIEPTGFPRYCAPHALAGVFDQHQLVLVGQGLQGGQVAGVAVEVDGHDGLGLGSDLPLHVGRIQIVGGRQNVGEHRHALLVDGADQRARIRHRAGTITSSPGPMPAGGRSDVDGGGAGSAGLHVLLRIDFVEPLGQQLGFRIQPAPPAGVPEEEGALVDHFLRVASVRVPPSGPCVRRRNLDGLFAPFDGQFQRRARLQPTFLPPSPAMRLPTTYRKCPPQIDAVSQSSSSPWYDLSAA